MKITKEEERSKKKISTQIDFFLNDSSTRDFFQQQNLLPKLNLSDFKILNCKINPLKIGRSRSAIELKLQLQSKSKNNQQQQICKSIVGKWRSDGQGKEIFDLLQEVWHKGFDDRRVDNNDENDHLKIYEPIAYFPDYNLMLTSKASGLRLKNMMVKEEEDDDDVNDHDYRSILETYLKQAAAWLAKLHSISYHYQLTHADIYSMQQEEQKLNEWSQHLSWLYPDFAERIHTMLSCILKIERSLDPKCFVLIHGDFHPGNIFVDGTEITVIDLEASYIFDPAKDLGYFIAKLLLIKRKYNLSSLDTDALQKCFLDKYAAEMSTIESLERVDLYKARSYIQHLHSRYCQHHHFRYYTRYEMHKPDPIDFRYWVNKAEECLKRLM